MILDDEEDVVDPWEGIIKEHKQKFGVNPVIIGLFWDNPNQVEKNIIEAIEKGEPYNEEKLITDDELESLEDGELFL
jgi:3-oxoacyl-[acyl-carrier-protein] synthase III